MKKIYLVVSLIAIMGLSFVGCNKKIKTEPNTDVVNKVVTSEELGKEEQIVADNSLKIEVTSEAEMIRDNVRIVGLGASFDNGMTQVVGTIENNTNNQITPYVNIMFKKANGEVIMTANAFANKIDANSSKQFVSNLIGDYSGYEMETELADVEK